MEQKLYEISIPSETLGRGFWLYVWEVKLQSDDSILYVGRTGDDSSINAQTPIARMSQHLGKNPKVNALKRHLHLREIETKDCTIFNLYMYGPIFSEAFNQEDHQKSKDIASGLERALCNALANAGYDVLNTVHSRKPISEEYWGKALTRFGEKFPNLLSSSRGEAI